MKSFVLTFAALLALLASPLIAQDVEGDWQGTIVGPNLRVILHIDALPGSEWKAQLFSIDQSTDGMLTNTITFQHGDLAFSIAAINASYKGQLSPDNGSFEGTFTQGKAYPLTLKRATKQTAWSRDPTPHQLSFIPVEKDVKLEVIDWGGAGRPIVLLTGLGNNAHIFDKFAPKLTSTFHVYGITRRGFGTSSSPAPTAQNYDSDRLGDDVLAVIDALHLDHPVLIGHSIAGEELSSIGSRHPEKVSGLVYLEAAYRYAFYDQINGNADIDALEIKAQIDKLLVVPNPRKTMVDIIAELPRLQQELQKRLDETAALPSAPDSKAPDIGPVQAILLGQRKYTQIKAPTLAIFADPHDLWPSTQYDSATQLAMAKFDLIDTTRQADAFQAGVPNTRVVRLSKANHYVFFSNEADVLEEINLFISQLPAVGSSKTGP
jgi:non-heme chloroperoxidase